MATVQELAAKLNAQVTAGLARNVVAMPEDRIAWKPLDKGRDALDQAKECAAINFIVASALRARGLPEDFSGAFQQYYAQAGSVQEALELLRESGEALTTAIHQLGAEDLEKTVTLPWDETPTTLAELLFLPYWNSAYHVGQISYIQTLYGDNEMH